jgi:hypothetical protein
MTVDPYAVLGVRSDASSEEIATAHRQAVKRAHPDAGGDAESFLHIQQAFELLSDPASRSRYDTERALAAYQEAYRTAYQAAYRTAYRRPGPPGPPGWPGTGSAPVSGQDWPPPGYIWVSQGPTYKVARPAPRRSPARSKPSTPWTIIIGSLMLLSLLSESSGVDLLWIALLLIPLVVLYQAKRIFPRGLTARRRRQNFGGSSRPARPPKRRTTARPKTGTDLPDL